MDGGFDNGYPSTAIPEAEETRFRPWSQQREESRQDAPPPLSAGVLLGGRFQLEQELGHPLGTMTWRAFDLKLHRPVLMHIMAPGGAHTGEVLAAARRAAIATDSRFLRVLDAVAAGPADPGSFIVCEFAPGRSISDLLQSGPLSALEAAWIVRELADALAPLHSQGIFHERLNPDNIIVTSTGNVKIVGLLIQAALHPWPGDQSLSWSDREARDVSDMGRLLYACLVSRWPAGTSRHPQPSSTLDGRVRWGLVPAPADRHGWVPPRQVRAGVSPALDVLCDQILSEVPRHNEVPIRTANEVAQALTRVLGSADAAADLERRLRYPAERADSITTSVSPDPGYPTDAVTALQPAIPDGGPPTLLGGPVGSAAGPYPADDGTGTTTMPGLDEDGYWTPAAAAGEWAHVPAPQHDDDGASDPPWRTRSRRSRRRPAAARPAAGSPAPVPSTAKISPEEVEKISHDLAQPRPSSRRWQGWLVALVAAVLVVCLIIVGVRRGGGSGPSAEAAVSTSATISISKVDDFDPQQDGGNDEENPNEVALAWDGKTSTAWKTLVYRGSAKLGQLKPGVGLVVDLGEETRFSSATVILINGATDVAMYVPSGSRDQAPMATIADWTKVAAKDGARGTTTLRPDSPVSSRYLLVYLSKLPRIAEDRYQGGIAEIRVNP